MSAFPNVRRDYNWGFRYLRQHPDRTSHPALPVACESVGLECFCLVEGPNEHSVGHAKELIRSICTHRRLSEAQRSVVGRKRIGPDSISFITGVSVPELEDPPLQPEFRGLGLKTYQ